MEAHGGRIWAESGGAGQGMRVTFTLPVADEAGPAPDVGPLDLAVQLGEGGTGRARHR